MKLFSFRAGMTVLFAIMPGRQLMFSAVRGEDPGALPLQGASRVRLGCRSGRRLARQHQRTPEPEGLIAVTETSENGPDTSFAARAWRSAVAPINFAITGRDHPPAGSFVCGIASPLISERRLGIARLARQSCSTGLGRPTVSR
jgi:hypothetical protein